MSNYNDKQIFLEDILYDMLSLLPSSYNKEVQDTNYFRLFRALSEQLAEAKIQINEVMKGSSISIASPESIYNNFGLLIQLEKRAEWSDEKYRKIISGVIQSLLSGPTKKSIIQAFRTFFDFDVNIYELFKDKSFFPNLPQEFLNNRFTFVVELEIPLELIGQTETIDLDSTYLINIIKPAHTFSFFFKTYVAEENYKKNYSIDKKIYQMAEKCLDFKIKREINRKINALFDNEFLSSGQTDKNVFSNSVRSKTNDKYLSDIQESARLGYLNYLKSLKIDDIFLYPIPKKIIQASGNKIYDYPDLTTYFNEEFPDFEDIISELSLDYVGKNVTVTDDIKELFKEKLEFFIVEATIENMTNYEENILQQLQEEAFDIEYQNYTLDEVNDIVNKIVVDFHISADEALLKVKKEALDANLISELGGRYFVYMDCLQKAENYRRDLERKFSDMGDYFGMDNFEWSAEDNNSEGIYGWRSHGYPLQLMTSTNVNVSQIGGPSLIGPNYALHDSDIFAIMKDDSGNIDIKTGKDFRD